MKQVLIVIPTYNEAGNISLLHTAIKDTFGAVQLGATFAYDILFIDSHSPDGTARIIKGLQVIHANVYLLNDTKKGLGKAYIRALAYGLKLKAYYAVVMMDADLSHAPKDVSRLLRELEAGADYAIGSRYVSGGRTVGWSFRRKIISRAANCIAHKLAGVTDDIQDATSGFKAIKVDTLGAVNLKKLHAKGYVFQVSLLKTLQDMGYRGSEVPITFTNRRHGASKLTLSDINEFLYHSYKLNPNGFIQRIFRFGVVGLSGTVVNLVILALLIKAIHIGPLVADIIAIECSIVSNFILNHTYTFKSRAPGHALLVKLGKYNAGALGGALVSFAIFTLLYKLMHLNYIAADAIAIVIAMSWNYWVSARFVWRPDIIEGR